MKKDRITQEAEILSHSLLNDVNTRIALSGGVSHSTVMKKAGLTAGQLRAILHNDTSIPVVQWMEYVLAAHDGSIDAYARSVFAHNSENIMVPNCRTPKVKTWLSAIATDINTSIRASDDPNLADEIGFFKVIEQGENATFHAWARLAILTDSTAGLDSGALEIVPIEIKKHIAEIWHSTK